MDSVYIDFVDQARSPDRRRRVRDSYISSRRGSVGIDVFDPVGVAELQRSISRATGRRYSISSSHAQASELTLEPPPFRKEEKGFDFEAVLRGILKTRGERDLHTRELGVVFDNLTVKGLGSAEAYQPSIDGIINPSNLIRNISSARHPQTRTILSGFEGLVRPGEMLLVLGIPGAGCSTFLKTLANQRAEYHSVTGDVNYDSLKSEEIRDSYRGDVLYCPEDDVHFASLTVEQTLRFAAKCRAPQGKERLGRSRKDYEDAFVDVLLTVFGLKHARNTPVGDASIRGVSGGEKKRVSICEVLASRACIGCWDNSTRGLDASTALEYVQALRIASDLTRMTTMVALYQAGESLYELFDKVCVIYEGRMAYFGSTDAAKQYFMDMGYQPVDRQTTADFLVSVTDPASRRIRPGLSPAMIPRTAEDFASAFVTSELGQLNRREIEEYRREFVGKEELAQEYRDCVQAESASHTRKGSPYLISLPMQTRAVMLRRVQIILGNPFATGALIFAYLYQGLIAGTVYFQMSTDTGSFFSRTGVLYFGVLFAALLSMSEIPALFSQRPIIVRQRDWGWYHPFVDSLALTLVDIPVTTLTIIGFSLLIYFLPRLQQSAGQFFIYTLFVLASTLTMKSYFRALAAVSKVLAPAQTLGGILVMGTTMYAGYMLPKPYMIGALKWLVYINPLYFAFDALMSNEFHTIHGECTNVVPTGPGYANMTWDNRACAEVGYIPGQSTVDGSRYIELSYGYSYSHLWRNFGIMVTFFVGFTSLLLFFTEINSGARADTTRVLFHRKAVKAPARPDDVEKAVPGSVADEKHTNKGGSSTRAITQAMTDIFTFRNINYTVTLKKGEQRRLLNNVSGYVAPGKLTALMGESGAGKTTLLNVLAERVESGVVTGERLINGRPLPRDFQAQTGYCQQMDTHLGTDTVREALLFSAILRQPASVPLAEKEAYVDECLRVCGLEEYQHASVGSLGVEFRKRTTIGVELAAKPKLLIFLDEPTSGLDSQSAWAIMSFLRDLADQGQAILCTCATLLTFTHFLKPSGELFQVFDRLVLLRKGGETVYVGDIGHNSNRLIKYFESNGARPCKPGENPAEYMLEAIGAGATAQSAQDWHAIWKESPAASQLELEMDQVYQKSRSQGPDAVSVVRHSDFANSWFTQVYVLTRRNFISYWRDPPYIIAKIMMNIFGGLFIGFSFFQADSTQRGMTNKVMAMFMATIMAIPLVSQLQAVFIDLRNIYEIRERPSKIYSWTALLASQYIVEIPWNIFGSSVFFLILYWTIGFDTDRAGYMYLLLCIVFPFYYTSVGQAVASMGPNVQIAQVLFTTFFSFVLTFDGVVQPFSQLGWWKWMYWVSPFRYLLEGLLGQVLGDQTMACADIELVTVQPPSGLTCSQYLDPYMSVAGGYLTNPNATSSCEFCSTRTTDAYLGAVFNIYDRYHWRDLGIMVAYVGFNLAATYVLTWFFRIRRGNLTGLFRKSK
ncbi:ABC transporter [Fistulina hepatica ATCC 64428]|uniref:ABC transporter n=1 Tax=Fistulina hepatica ATCC 64428 TaxID=1128425 RepID=A0A0D7AME8_9AGAR|nr:ABC transporter [Fistulina hepatica ATCC 64428]